MEEHSKMGSYYYFLNQYPPLKKQGSYFYRKKRGINLWDTHSPLATNSQIRSGNPYAFAALTDVKSPGTKQQQGEITQQGTNTLPSPGMMRRVTVFPASLMRLTMSECDLLVMEHPFTAKIRSPTFSLPQRSAGLPSIIRPIL